MKRILSLSLALLFLLGSLSIIADATTHAEADEIIMDISGKAKAAYLYSYNGDRVLFSQGEDEILAPVSTAKMMAGLLVCREYSDMLDKNVTVSNEMLAGLEGTSMGLRSGMTVSVRDMLYGTVCGVNNDAAMVLANACAGDLPEFVDRMNKLARRLDMRDTHYTDPTGLDEDAKTTLADTAKLAATAAKDELYMQISSSPSFELSYGENTATVYNRNALIHHFSAQGYINTNAKGLIAGGSEEGGYVLATYAEKNGNSLLCLVMGAQEDQSTIYSYDIANKLLDVGISEYSEKKILSAGYSAAVCDVSLALTDASGASVDCVVDEDVYAFLHDSVDVSKLKYVTYLHDDKLTAPITEGMVVGGIDIYCEEQRIASARLVAGASIEANPILSALDIMRNILLSRVFVMALIISVVAIAIYLFSRRRDIRHSRVSKIQYKRFY